MEISRFGRYIKSLRGEKGLSTHKLAELTGVSQSYISHVENGRKKNVPSPEILKKLSTALDANYNNLMAVAGYIDEEDLLEPVDVIISHQEEKSKKSTPVTKHENKFSVVQIYLKEAEGLLTSDVEGSQQFIKVAVMTLCSAVEVKVNEVLIEAITSNGTSSEIAFDYLNSHSLKEKLSSILMMYLGLDIKEEGFYSSLMTMIDVRNKIAHSMEYSLTPREAKFYLSIANKTIKFLDSFVEAKQ
jgi:transcriptional regulator with XRE-family HTH domain